MPKPSFNEYATQQYHQLIASGRYTSRAEALAEASSQAALAVEARLCSAPDATQAASAAISDYDERQGRSADRILEALANGDVDTETGYRSAELRRTIAILGNGKRKIVGDLTMDDLDAMTENRKQSHTSATKALVAWAANVNTVAPAITLHGTVGAALDAGEFRDPVKAVDLSPAKGKRIIPRKARSGD